MEPHLNRNLLRVTLAEFKQATKVFVRKRLALGTVLMAFEGGFLSLESGEVTAVMRAEGEWHGRALFSPSVLRALATVPPIADPIPIAYAEGRILFGGLTIPCQWSLPSQELVQELLNPDLIDLLAMGRTLSRADMRGTELGKRVRSAIMKADRRIGNAAKQLADLGISEQEIRALVEARIAARIKHPG
jgi:hypothetical protein